MFFHLISAAVAESETAEAAKTVSPIIKKLLEVSFETWLLVAALILTGIILLMARRTSRRWSSRMISFASLSIALSFLLSCIRLYRMPNGGSITPASMLPLMLFATAYGIGPGMVAGLIYGLLQCTQGIVFISGIQFLFDYIISFSFLGLAGIYRSLKKKNVTRLIFCLVIAAFLRFISHTIAGMYWYYGEYETGDPFFTKFLASVVYNGSYILPDLLICMLLAIPIHKPVLDVMQKVK